MSANVCQHCKGKGSHVDDCLECYGTGDWLKGPPARPCVVCHGFGFAVRKCKPCGATGQRIRLVVVKEQNKCA